jgi:hypothetical protein
LKPLAMATNTGPDAESSLIDMIEKSRPQPASASIPPGMEKRQKTTADELYRELNRYPLFMTSLEDAEDDTGESNDMLEALKALAYEGTRAEIAGNFKTQGNEAVAEKRWVDAREFYSKALAALKGAKVPIAKVPDDGAPEMDISSRRVVEVEDEEAEERIERKLEEACLANRALCQLEMSSSAFL